MDDVDKYIKNVQEENQSSKEFIDNHWFTRLQKRVIGLEALMTFIYTVVSFLRTYIFKPIWKIVKYFWQQYRKVWLKFAYKTTDGDKRKFSKAKGLGVFVSTLVALFIGYHTAFIIKDTSLYLLTVQRSEIVYLSNAQEIDAENNIHSVQGCIVAKQEDGSFSCSTDNSLYFRIEPSLFAHMWYLTNRGDIFYPDYVAATIAPGWQECTITSYGLRAKLFIRRLQIYPELLSVDCQKI